MAFDEFSGERVRQWFRQNRIPTEEMKMMGGLGFMLNGKMVCGITKNLLMARIDPHDLEGILKHPIAAQKSIPNALKFGFLFLEADAFDLDEELDFWLSRCMEYHPKAPVKKKKV